MTPREQEVFLVRIDERTKTIFNILNGLPCKEHKEKEEKNTTKIAKHEERLDNHSKFLWGSFTAALSAIVGLVVLAGKTAFKQGP